MGFEAKLIALSATFARRGCLLFHQLTLFSAPGISSLSILKVSLVTLPPPRARGTVTCRQSRSSVSPSAGYVWWKLRSSPLIAMSTASTVTSTHETGCAS